MKVIDETIIQRLNQQDPTAFEVVYNAYYTYAYFKASKYLDSEHLIEDIVQEAFIKVWLHKDFQNEEHVVGFLLLSVRHSCLNYLRDVPKERRMIQELQNSADLVEDPRSDTRKLADLFNYFDKEIQTLSPSMQEYYKLRRAGYKGQQISKRLNISSQRVYNLGTELKNILRKLVVKHRLTPIVLTLADILLHRFKH